MAFGHILLPFCSLVLALTQDAFATQYFQHVDDLPSDQRYDFIVVGTGAGGATVAGRLAEDRRFNVLAIEAGPLDTDFPNIAVPGLQQTLIGGPIDWNLSTVPQVNAGGRVFDYSRAKVLGGCTSHNGMVYTRGSRDDYDRYARIVGDSSFSWDSMQRYNLRNERLQDGDNVTGHLDPSVHGRQGKIAVSAPFTERPVNDLILETTRVLSEEFPFKLDYNDGMPVGIGWLQFTIDNGTRSNSAAGYIRTAGDNLHVLLNTQVTRVLPNSAHDTEFRTVELGTTTQDLHQITAEREVIISGGAINSPQILLASGIGPRSELAPFGINITVDNPSVGKNLSEQPSVVGLLETTLPYTYGNFNVTIALEEWQQSHTGPLAVVPFVDLVGWMRVPENSSALSGLTDPVPGPNSPHHEFLIAGVVNLTDPSTLPVDPSSLPAGLEMALTFAAINLHPLSRGSITLNSSDPFTNPNIDLNMFNSEVDLVVMRENIRAIQRFYAASPWNRTVGDMALPSAGIITSDEQLDEYIRQVVAPTLHVVGSLSMSPRGASWGVVDPDFRVKGTSGLRVVDASVLPFMPSAHTQAPVYAFAELAAELIREAWND